MKAFHLVILLAVASLASAQQRWTSKLIGTITPDDATTRYVKTFPGPHTMEIKSGVRLYKVNYRSADSQKFRNVSGLVALPDRGAAKGLVVFFCGTMIERALAPSRYTGKNKNAEVELAVLGYCLAGYAVAIPDTLGFGDDKPPHPYPAGSLNARTGIDIVSVAKAVAAKDKNKVGDHLFVSGYSEGGATAMWMVRKVTEEKGSGLSITAATPMSGPYDLSGTMAKWMLAQTSNPTSLAFKFFAAAYSAYGLKSYYPGMKMADVFVPSYASYVPYVLQQDSTLEQAGKKFLTKGIQVGAIKSAQKALQPSFRKQLAEGDDKNPFVRAFKANDCYRWEPKTKMLLPYVPGDQIVPAENTLMAEAYLNRPDLVRTLPLAGNLNHVTGMVPAVMASRAFFDGGFAAVDSTRTSIVGSVSYMKRIAIPPNAVLKVTLSHRSVTLGQTRAIFGPRQVPVPFRLYYDRAKVEATEGTVLRAEIIVNGRVVEHRDWQNPDLSQGTFDLVLDGS